MGLWLHSHGNEQPPHQKACGITNSGWLAGDRCTNSATTTSVSGGKIAAAMASGQMLLLKGPRSRPLTGDENQLLKPKSRSSGARVALTVSSAEATASARGSLTYGDHHLSIDDSGHLPTNTAPANGGRPKAHQQVLTPVLTTRTRTGPSQNTSTALAAYDVLCDPPQCSQRRKEDLDVADPCAARPSPGWRTDSCTLSKQQQFAFPRVAGGRLLRRAGGRLLRRARGCPSPPNAGGRSGSPAHAEVGPNSPRPPPQPG
jgi:hypothetical protein